MTVHCITRREFLRVSASSAAATAAAACVVEPSTAPAEPAQAAPAAPTAPAAPALPESRYSEAPMLAELVSQGELPPVDERLPENPDTVAPVESIGKYGGAWRRGFTGVSDRWGPTKMKANNLLWYTQDIVLRPALVESWDVNEDASTWVFHLRRGTKWSDGEPFTSADFQWYYDYHVTNTEISPIPSGELSTGTPSQLGVFSSPDDYTVSMAFAHPKPTFGYPMAGHWHQPFVPHHYMAQFHMDLVEDKDALAALVTEKGFDSWSAYYVDRNSWFLNPDRPTTDPWMNTNALSEQVFVMERNPYFWQVDTEGQQLPYIDTVTHRLYESADVFNMWILGGEIDCQSRGVGMSNYTLYKENEDQGGYDVKFLLGANHTAVELNMTAQEPRLRELFQDRRVRMAVSHCANREEMNDLVHDGLGTPRQYSPISTSPNYHERLANTAVEYDPDAANALLDEAGYTERDADGYRTFKDGSGETISIIIEGTSQEDDTVMMLVSYLEAIGLKASYKFDERSLYEERVRANEVDAASWGGNRTILPIIDPGIMLGTMEGFPWANAWGRWKNRIDDPTGEEPPEGHWIWDIWEIWDQVAAEPDEAERNRLFAGILDIWADELPMIGFVGELPELVIVSKAMHNYPGNIPSENALSGEHFLQAQFVYWDPMPPTS